ncbi:MAG TPA: YHYH protein [Rhodocyclaceae bacterium]|jgi:hypothetical protein|nr:YHYH protein [Rhodocyclaceae bacterium]
MKSWLTLLVLALCCSSAVLGHDLTALPLGDGKISQAPKTGWIWACHVDPQGGGAQVDGPWINKKQGTFDLTSKAVVPGAVTWPYKFDISVQRGRRIFSSNDLPAHPTGSFPIPAGSDAWRYDRNPNRINAQNVFLELPAIPALAAQPSCVPGAIGYLLSGAVLFNALDAPGRDAVAHETQDSCQGHPQQSGVYHYHSVSSCVDTKREANGHSSLVGYLIDGFGIYGRYGDGGKLLTSADLDECHGHTHKIMWDGKWIEMYHYHATWDFPYTAGCLRGNYRMSDVAALSGPPPQMGMGQRSGPQSDMPRPGQGGPDGRRPDLNKAAASLGIDVQRLRAALGPPPPDLSAAASRLGISVERLQAALDAAR